MPHHVRPTHYECSYEDAIKMMQMQNAWEMNEIVLKYAQQVGFNGDNALLEKPGLDGIELYQQKSHKAPYQMEDPTEELVPLVAYRLIL